LEKLDKENVRALPEDRDDKIAVTKPASPDMPDLNGAA
jgi:hypothetical protein